MLRFLHPNKFWLLPAIVQNSVLPRLRLASNIKALLLGRWQLIHLYIRVDSENGKEQIKVMSVIDKQDNSLAVLLLLGTAFSAVSCHT